MIVFREWDFAVELSQQLVMQVEYFREVLLRHRSDEIGRRCVMSEDGEVGLQQVSPLV
jgi:hypothetical protein